MYKMKIKNALAHAYYRLTGRKRLPIIKGQYMPKSIEYYKVLPRSMMRRGITYENNCYSEDTRPFLPYEGVINRGGLFFTTKDHLWKFLHLGDYIAKVELPPDSLIVCYGDRMKATKLHIKQVEDIRYYQNLVTKEMVSTNLHLMKHYVQRNQWNIFEYFKDLPVDSQEYNEIFRNLSWNQQLYFVRRCPEIINSQIFHAMYRTDKINFFINLFDEYENRRYKFSLSHVPPTLRTHAVCEKAIYVDPINFQYVINQTEELCGQAVSLDHTMFALVKDKNKNICYYACSLSKNNIEFVPPEIMEEIGHMIYSELVERDPNYFFEIPKDKQTIALAKLAVFKDGWLLSKMDHQFWTKEVTDIAFEQCPEVKTYIGEENFQWLRKVEEEPEFELEKAVVLKKPEVIIKEKIVYVDKPVRKKKKNRKHK